jgi:thiol-disulfide isomerase/thioredoxin
VILDFWATWCPPCEFQVPELNAFLEAHRGEPDVEVWGISVDTDGTDVVGAWAEEKGVRYRILMGDEDLARRYGALGFPTLIVVSPDGSVDSRHVGIIEIDDLEAALAEQRESAAG